MIQDPRLTAESALFPYQWRSLSDLEKVLSRLRPALESGEVRELAEALPEVEMRVDTLIADSIPAPLASRVQDVRGRMIALKSALDLAESLTEAALSAPPLAPAEAMLELGGGETVQDSGAAGEPGSGTGEDARNPPPMDDSTEALAAEADTAAEVEGEADSVAAPDSFSEAIHPAVAYLEAWRDAYQHAEAILHSLRDPVGEEDEEPPSRPRE